MCNSDALAKAIRFNINIKEKIMEKYSETKK